jgi:acetyl esterase/lipase
VTKSLKPPPFDPELKCLLAKLEGVIPSTRTPEMIPSMRNAPSLPIAELIAGRPITHTERRIAGPEAGSDLTISVFAREDHKAGGPGIYFIHGGGMISGNRFLGISVVLNWVDVLDAVAISVDYRLAPEHPDPTPLRDSYAGLTWMADHAHELGFDPKRLVIAGSSAGGGLAAGITLMIRDNGGPSLAAQMLIYPMIDDRNETISSHQIDGIGVWDRGSNDTGWNAYLGDRRKTEQVSIYAAPARATDLSNLPPAFIDVGSADVLRDEGVAYASKIWAAGGVAELHVWPGGYHGFDLLFPNAVLSRAMIETRTSWLRRVLGVPDPAAFAPTGSR